MARTTEADMIELLREKYTRVRRGTTADRYVRAAHVRYTHLFDAPEADTQTQYSYGVAERIADYMVLDTYGPGEIIGTEIKVSRSDWLTELADPTKADALRQFCHRWYLVATPDVLPGGPDTPISSIRDELPDGWGLMMTGTDRHLRVRIQSPRVDTPTPMPLAVLAQFARSIQKTAQKDAEKRT